MNHDDEEKTTMKRYLDMKDKAEELGAGSDAYRDIREWFIEKYPEIEEYHKEMEQKKKERKEKSIAINCLEMLPDGRRIRQ